MAGRCRHSPWLVIRQAAETNGLKRTYKMTTLLSLIFLSTKVRAAISSGAPGTGCERYCDGWGSGGVVFTCAHACQHTARHQPRKGSLMHAPDMTARPCGSAFLLYHKRSLCCRSFPAMAGTFLQAVCTAASCVTGA